jgi:hypothetical protein
VVHIPSDGAVVKDHLRAFIKRHRRRWPGLRVIFWKMEFQARSGVWSTEWQRCAPHFHVWTDRSPNLATYREWCSRAWWEIVGSRSRSHLQAGTRVEVWTGDPVRYCTKYARKLRDKSYQNRVPDGFYNVGRFWSLVDVRPQWEGVALTTDEFYKLRRVLVRWRRARVRARGGRFRVRGRSAGTYVIVPASAGVVMNRLLGWVRGPVPEPGCAGQKGA